LTVAIDVDQHLFEDRDTWSGHIDPGHRDDALRIEDDDLGWPWLVWRSKRLYPIEVQFPGRPGEIGDNRVRMENGDPSPGRYEDIRPASYGAGAARLAALDDFGLDGCVLFPNYGLIWERALADAGDARHANMTAYNRWMAAAIDGARSRLFGVAHLGLSDVDWATGEIARLGRDGIRLAMIAPAPVDGFALSDPRFDPVWRACCDHGVSPVFHVSSFESPINPAWHAGEDMAGDSLLDSVFLWVAPAVALANMIVHGLFDRFPALRLGIVELTAGWVPGFLLNIDGAYDFYSARHGVPFGGIRRRPSEYVYEHVRVAALPYEMPAHLVKKVGDRTFMIGSDWPHAEGVADPLGAAERAASGLDGVARENLLAGNAAWLLDL
jgi:predicted TIM-barrel fold metal-dependent hydrolase